MPPGCLFSELLEGSCLPHERHDDDCVGESAEAKAGEGWDKQREGKERRVSLLT